MELSALRHVLKAAIAQPDKKMMPFTLAIQKPGFPANKTCRFMTRPFSPEEHTLPGSVFDGASHPPRLLQHRFHGFALHLANRFRS